MAIEIATAFVQVVPSMKGVGKAIESAFGSASETAGNTAGIKAGNGFAGGFGAKLGVITGIAQSVAGKAIEAFMGLSGEITSASDSAQKFASTLNFAGVSERQIKRLTASTQDYADKTVYDLNDIRNTTAQLAANGVPNYDRLAEAAGNLNAVAGGSADTFKSVAMVLTQTAGQGKLTTENWNQLSDAIPGASGKIQQALKEAGAYTGSIAELSRTYIEDKRNRKANAKACLTKALEGTRWAVGTVETGTITGTADLAFYHCTVLDAVQKTADTYGLEVQTEYQPDPTGNQIGRRIIHLVEHRGSTNTTKRFEYGKDLTQIKRDIDSGDVITRLYGWGKGIEQTNDQGEATGGYSRKISFADVNDGKPYVQDDQALANWGIPGPDGTKHHSEASVDFPDCEDPKELLTLTKNALKTRTTPVVSYTADVTALGQAGLSAEGTDVGDGVQIIDTSFTTPLRLEGRILQIEEDLAGSLADTKITLGNIRQSYTQRLAAQQQALDKLVSNSGAWNSAAGGAGPYMKDLIDRINQIMNATGGYTYLKPGQGIYVYDKPEDQNPTQCIHIGGGYWRIADHKKANGDWDFRSLANGKGIFADTIFTGRLSGAAGLNYWDLDTGRFVMTDANGNETVHLDGNGAGNLLVGTFQTARTGKRVRISPDFDSYQIGGTETYDGSGISFPLDGAYASSPSIWSYSRSNKTGDMSGLAMLSGYRTAGTPGAFGRFWSHKYLSDPSKIESQAYLMANTEYSKDSTTDSGGSLDLYSRQGHGGEAILNAWSPSDTCSAGVKATGSKAKVYATAGDANGEIGLVADISTGYMYLGGYLGGINGRNTFQTAWWVNKSGAPMTYSQYTFTSSNPAKYGSYKALATVDHRGDDWALIWSTVSDCGASGWLVWVSTGPEKVVTEVTAHWNKNNSTGVVSNLSINVNHSNLYIGTKAYYLNTIGFLKK